MPNVRMPLTYVDAREVVQNALDTTPRVYSKRYSEFQVIGSTVTHYHIEDSQDEEGYANFDLTLTLNVPSITPAETFVAVERTKNLRVLSSHADTKWTYSMIGRVWDGDYPSTVAFDKDTGDVYLFNISYNRVELVEFGKLKPSELEVVLTDLDERDPFFIYLTPDAMFDVLSGAEGTRHLQVNVYVEFNCSIPVRVYSVGY